MRDRAWVEQRLIELKAALDRLFVDYQAHKGAIAALEEVLMEDPPAPDPPPTDPL